MISSSRLYTLLKILPFFNVQVKIFSEAKQWSFLTKFWRPDFVMTLAAQLVRHNAYQT